MAPPSSRPDAPAAGGLRVRPYAPGDAADWDAFAATAPMATLLHTRRFLGYHGDRFHDASAWLLDAHDRPVGVLPAALDPADSAVVISHPGASYGGVVHAGWLTGDRMLDAFGALRAHYRGLGCQTLRYKAVPRLYHQVPAEDDRHALFRLGARPYRVDLASVVDLAHRLPVSDRRQRGLRKARRAAMAIEAGPALIPEYWPLLEENLRKHGTRPVHSTDEMATLMALFPTEIRLIAARHEGRLAAGLWLFVTPTAWHAQYIASNATGAASGALELLFEQAIAEASAARARFFSFGISTEDEGRVLNEGLYRFKSEFGGGGMVHEFYDWDLRSDT